MPRNVNDAIAIRMSDLDDVCSSVSQPLVLREWWKSVDRNFGELRALRIKGRHCAITFRELMLRHVTTLTAPAFLALSQTMPERPEPSFLYSRANVPYYNTSHVVRPDIVVRNAGQKPRTQTPTSQ